MYTEKPKNEFADISRRSFRKGLLVGSLITAIVVAALIGIVATSTTTIVQRQGIPEILVVTFNKAEPTLTEYYYSGAVHIRVEGTGQAAGSDYSDAFYQYTQGGQVLAQPLTHQFDLEIDGNRAIITLGLEANPPAYNPEHVYDVSYNVGQTPRQIAFRISDLNVGDNTGQFLITIEHSMNGIGG